MRLRPWVKAVLGILLVLSFCFLGGIVDFEFTWPSVLIMLGVLGIFGGSAYLIRRFD